MTRPGLADITRVFGRIGLLSFGGPAAQIALMHRELVETRDWLSNDSFLRALSLCMLLPGPEAMQLATYAGWRLQGTVGGLIAGALFVLPGALVIGLLALGYALYGQLPLVQAGFAGIKATVVVILLQALVKLSRKTLTTPTSLALATAAFAALFVFGLPFPLVIAGAALCGAIGTSTPATAPATPPPTRARSLRTTVLWGTLWALPVLAVWLADQTFLTQIALFFSKLAVVTFGGAYAVLAYMTQTVVQDFGWISTGQMIDALGLAETTPGPLILVTQFVALLAGFADGGITMALAAGGLALWVTFTPCFLWIFLAGPYLDQIAARPRLSAALQAITAAVVGVILNLGLWFALHVLFREVRTGVWAALPWPTPASLDPAALGLTALAALLLLGLKRGLAETLALMALAGLGLSVLT
ncbi:chromate efflux transporter [uncultured Roseobacter sp.]|uniref:chromate efflux transporter n=1 Tax=uncultured Roseobacter sp. TaxID=114847 RepID=UPI00263A0F4A|nr:chromate efflux transporter [uncultured Roseobacter sp.]